MPSLHDDQFIVLISLILFVILFGKKIYKLSVQFLDNKISEISNSLEISKNRLLSSSTKLELQKEELENFIYNKDNVLYQIQTKVESYYEKTIEKLNKKIKNQQISLSTYLDNTYDFAIYNTEQDLIKNMIYLTKIIIKEEITDEMHQKYIKKSIIEIKDILNDGK